MNGGAEVLVIYDKQCPACDYYCNMVRIRESVGRLVLVDARDGGPVMDEIRFCRKVRFLGQNPKIGYQKFNDLQTAKTSKKQLCDRTRCDRSARHPGRDGHGHEPVAQFITVCRA